MSSTPTQSPDAPRLAERRRRLRRRAKGRMGVWPVVWALLVGLFVFFGFLSFSGQPVSAPGWVTTRIESVLNGSVPGFGVRLGTTELFVDPEGRPRVRLRNVSITDPGGNRVAELNRLGASFSPAALMRGEVVPSVLRLSGAQLTVRRNAAGEFTLDLGGMGGVAAEGTLGTVLDALDAAFDEAPLSGLERIEANDVTILLEDARSGRVWQATGGSVTLQNLPGAVSIAVTTEVFNGTEDLAQVQLSFRSDKASQAASLGVTLQNAAASDIALQSPALAFLAPLDAPISGAMRLTIKSDGAIEQLAATLDIKEGVVRPDSGAVPVGFDRARLYLTYDPATGRIAFTEISAQSEALAFTASGQAYLAEIRGGWPGAVVAQLDFAGVSASADVFDAPLNFERGHADFRLRIAPFEIDVGAARLEQEGVRFDLAGHLAARETGWEAAVDLSVEKIAAGRVMSLWPERLAPKPRKWVTENVIAGDISDVDASIRLVPGQRPVAAFDFEFENADARVLKHFPPITGGAGRASLVGQRYAMEIDGGVMTAPDGGRADFSGSRFTIPDVTAKPTPAHVELAAAGRLPTVLALMDNAPFRLLEKARRPADFASAEAQIRADIALPLKRGMTVSDVDFTVTGTLTDVASDQIVPDRLLTADQLAVGVTPTALIVEGRAFVDAVPLDARWSRALGPDAPKSSRVDARVRLTPEALALAGVRLPAGMLTRGAPATLALELAPEAPVAFEVTSDLRGAGLTIAPLGWSKAADTSGRFEANGTVSPGGATVERLVLEGPGLAAEGRVTSGEGPGRFVAEFDRVSAGQWFSAPVTITGRGERPPDIRIGRGRVDLGSRPRIDGAGAGGGALRVDLESLRISDGIALSPFAGEFTTGGGLSGSFTGNVNGGAPVRGTLVPASNGSAVRIVSADAGRTIRDAGLVANARGGEMELILLPKEAPGAFNGQVSIRSVRLVDAPVLAGLLDAVSIVGLIDEMQGSGILFDTVEGRFDLAPGRIVVHEGSAVGASLGISLDGIYEPATKTMDMGGVISPIYLVNGIGQIFTRPGEGLFGFTFRLTGTPGATEVSLNPLSILTPGIFREIFRRPPPQPDR